MQVRNKPYEGLFITIEGGEGAGKSTLSERLALELQQMGYEVVMTREPGGSKLSEHIRSLLLHPPADMEIGTRSELFLFLAARLQHIEEGILPHLREKKVVICERFNDSTIAYQGYARHLGMGYVEKVCAFACEEMEPDATLLLDIDPVVGLARMAKRAQPLDRLESEHIQFHQEVRHAFLQLADKHEKRMTVLDASSPLDEVVQGALEAIRPHLLLKPH